MTGKLHQIDNQGPPVFAFAPENFRAAQALIAKYPEGRQQSALIPLLALAQRQNDNWLPQSAMDYIASILGLAPVRVYEVATFYTMFNLKPVAQHVIEVCTTTPCWLRGSDAILDICERYLGIRCGESTVDNRFGLREIECLGACVNAPMCRIGDHYYEDLTPEAVTALIDTLAQGQTPQPGPQSGRRSSEPAQ